MLDRPRAALLALPAVLAALPGPGLAADAKAGRQKAAMCQACHGLDGIAKQPDAANLAGQTEIYLTTQLSAFKSGERQNEQMAVIAEGLSEADIADLAAWYSSIQISVTLPE